jgi:hypothetical protein
MYIFNRDLLLPLLGNIYNSIRNDTLTTSILKIMLQVISFFHQIFCFFRWTRMFSNTYGVLFVYKLHIILKTQVFLKPLAHVSHQRVYSIIFL